MKKVFLFMISVAILLSVVGCGNTEETPPEVTPNPVIDDKQTSGTGISLSSEELEYFQKYTEAIRTEYVEERGVEVTCATEISCFFTSLYNDVRDMNFEEFMCHFPEDADNPAYTTELEFEALKSVEGWPFTETESIDEIPVPIHKYPRSRVDAVLTKYAGITTAELNTTGVAYLKEYDAFYTYTSDFGAGTFIPCSGEKNGDIVTLWEEPAGYDGSISVLTLQKNGEEWRIISHNTANDLGSTEVLQNSGNNCDGKEALIDAYITSLSNCDQERDLVISHFGDDAWDNVSYTLLEIAPTDGVLGYREISTGAFVDRAEYERILYEFWDNIANQEGVTYNDLFLAENEPPENIANKRVDIVAKYSPELPVELVTVSDTQAYEVLLSFNNATSSSTGFENFHFVIDNKGGEWQILQGLSWNEPYPDNPIGD